MRIELRIDGGFAYVPGLVKPIVVDSAQLAADEAAAMDRLCRAVLDLPQRRQQGRSEPSPDARRYRLTIDIDGVVHELVAADPVDSPMLADLIERVQSHRVR